MPTVADRIVVVIVTLNTISLLIVIVLLWTVSHPVRDERQCDTLCVPCLREGSCCDCLNRQLQSYTKQRLEKTITDYMSASDGLGEAAELNEIKYAPWEVNPSALIEGDRQYKENTKEQPPQTIHGWRLGYKEYLRNGVDLVNGRVFVPKDGVYSVYSYILFGDMAPQPTYQHMEQRVYRYNVLERREQELIRNSRPYTESLVKTSRIFNSYMSSDLLLKAGDFVYVKVSNVSMLRDPERNYFGLYLV